MLLTFCGNRKFAKSESYYFFAEKLHEYPILLHENKIDDFL